MVASASESAVATAPASAVADGTTSAVVTVTLRTAARAPVAGRAVMLSSSRGAVDAISAPSGTSDPTGVVTFAVTSTTAGPASFTAFEPADAVTVLAPGVVTFVAGPAVDARSTLGVSPAAVVADGVTTAIVQVTLADAHGNPTPGRTVTLASSRGASDAISAASGLSDGAGRVSFAVRSTVAGTSTFTAVDATDLVALSVAAVVTFTPGGVVGATSTAAAAPASVVADGATPAIVTVTLRDANDNAVSGKAVSVTSSRGATDTVSAASGLSDPSGVVTFAVTSTTAGAASLAAQDVTDGVAVLVPASAAFVAGAAADAQSTAAAAPASVVADGTASSTVTVTLRDAYGNPAPGRTVTLASSRGAADTISAASGPSDASGVVTWAVRSTTAGAPAFTAFDATDAVTLSQTASVLFVPGAVSAAQSTVAASPGSVTADGSAAASVTVTLLDAYGNPVPGKTVGLASSRGATDTVSAASGASSASGVVTFTVKSTTAGAPTFTATDVTDGLQITRAASVTFTAGPVSWQQSTLTVSPASIVADGTTASALTVTLRDVNGNPVSGKTVTISHLEWPQVGTVSAASGPSSAAGVVTFTMTSTVTGTARLQGYDATDSVGLWATFPSVTFTAGPVVDARSTVVASSARAFASGPGAATVTVTLRDANGNGVPGKTVTLASSRNALDAISPASGVTDGSGAVAFGVGSSTFGSSVFSANDTTDALALSQQAAVTFTRYLAFTTQPPASTAAATPFSPQPVVALQDASGNVDASYAGTVTLAIGTNPGGGTLAGTAVVAASAGVATFSGLSIDKAGAGYTLAASDPVDGLPASTSRAFAVVVGPPAKLGFTLQPSNSGGGIGPTFQVSIFDAGGNPTTATGYPVTVAIGTNPSAATLIAPPTATLTSTSARGVATFTGLAVSTPFSTPGTGYTLVATDAGDGLAPATSAPFDVDTPTVVGTGTAGSCTEAELDAALASGGNVTFSCGASPVTITLTSTKTVSANTSLDGGGVVTLSGGGAVLLFSVNPGVTMALSNLTVTAGRSAGSGGAIYNGGTLSVTRCTFSNNSAIASNGYASYDGDGGAIFNAGTLLVASSTFSGNVASMNADIRGVSGNGGAIFSRGTLLVADSTFSGNMAYGWNAIQGSDGNGGAIVVDGAGSAQIVSSTFSGNGASAAGGVGSFGGYGGNLWGGGNGITLTNTIVAASAGGANCGGTFTDGGHNLDSDGSCGVGAAKDPLLGAAGLAWNGGPTQTIAVQAGSPAIGGGDLQACLAAPVIGLDQRGVARGPATCTIGALEDPSH